MEWFWRSLLLGLGFNTLFCLRTLPGSHLSLLWPFDSFPLLTWVSFLLLYCLISPPHSSPTHHTHGLLSFLCFHCKLCGKPRVGLGEDSEVGKTRWSSDPRPVALNSVSWPSGLPFGCCRVAQICSAVTCKANWTVSLLTWNALSSPSCLGRQIGTHWDAQAWNQTSWFRSQLTHLLTVIYLLCLSFLIYKLGIMIMRLLIRLLY